MRVQILFGGMCLAFRKTMDFAALWSDPRGLTGSELGAVRIAEELAALGHEVTLRTVSQDKEWGGFKVADIAEPIESCDVAISINEPDLLRGAPTGAFRVCMYFLNDVTFCRVGFYEHVDLFCSPSAPHLEQMRTNPKWHKVEVTPEFPDGREIYKPEPEKWAVVELGCDPERLEGQLKIPGRVIHCSSPDRGSHWLLQVWPAIKRAVPHATLHLFYRFDPWLRGFDQTPFFPAIEPLRQRANYVEECLKRFASRPELGVVLRDSVSRETIELEMAQAECLAFPCDTTAWSEGFSCTVLEACAARACPVITDCDALAGVYGGALPIVYRVGDWQAEFRDRVIRVLTDADYRNEVNNKARAFAEGLTWKRTAERILEEIERRRVQ